MKRRRRPVRVGLGMVALAGLVAFLWTYILYTDIHDPKNIRYVLWKWGISEMDLDIATGNMIGDVYPQRLVVGKTKAQLLKRFGILNPPSDVTPYLRGCYEASPWYRGKDVLFLRGGPWMVVFEGDKATALVLIKGC